MLQQTTVAAVVPYFHRFLAAFPTVQSLAAAREEPVLKLWEGLGYYRRARHLHAAAKRLVEEHGCDLPDDPAVWAALPGVGRYILGAVLSQAFDRHLPIVEANSLRVLSRLYGYRGDPREGEGKMWAWSAAEVLLPVKRVGDFNQALMELGALVCTPTSPKCSECPVKGQCEASRLGLQATIPPPKRDRETVRIREAAVVIRDRGRILMCRRPADANRWQNMWEVPHGEAMPGELPADAAARIATELTGLKVRLGPRIATIDHTVTRHSISMAAFEAIRRRGRFVRRFYAEARWLDAEAIDELPLSTPQRRLMAAARKTRVASVKPHG